MALGGGTWTAQDKVLPGTYQNFTSVARASAALSTRGIAAVALPLNWGKEGEVFKITASDFQKNSLAVLGYGYDAPEMLPLRELFCKATTLYCYRLGSGATAATNTYGTAKYPGTRGNDIKIVITSNIDNENAFDVSTYIGTSLVDTQTVTSAEALVDNNFVVFTKTAALEATAGTPMTGGINCADITGEMHQAFLDKIESYSYNVLCCSSADETVVKLYSAFNKRVRDTLGCKSQVVAWKAEADYEGVIGVWNTAKHSKIATVDEHSAVYWVAGAEAGVAVNASLTMAEYNGELDIDVDYTQEQLKEAILAGKFMFHLDNGDVYVLEDINTLVTLTDEKNEVFQSNQSIRTCDGISIDVAVMFGSKYIGKINNDASGRASLWNDVVKVYQSYEEKKAIEDFDPDTVVVEIGGEKGALSYSANGYKIVNTMSKLYTNNVIQ